MIRALNRLVYRWYNDGDRFWEGYGTETAGPAHSFLVNSDQINRGEQRKLEAFVAKAKIWSAQIKDSTWSKNSKGLSNKIIYIFNVFNYSQ